MGELVRCCVAAAIPATGSPPAAIKVFGQFLYTAQGQCMDLKYKCSLVTGEDLQLIVSVQYEPGAPVTYFDEDRWDEL